MSSLIGSVRRLTLAPLLAEVTSAGRGFPVVPGPGAEHLDAIPQTVVCGFEWGIDSSGLWELRRRLALVAPELRGFAYEGAEMAAVVLDAMSGFRTRRTLQLLSGPGRPHLLLAYIGVGFAMARLPRPLWRRVLPDLDLPHHPTMSWLAVDGYGFDRAYFDTRSVVHEQREPAAYPWLGRPDYFPRAVDQGVGRALWFIHGADVREVARALALFPARRHADLWSGVGLAASVAGGATGDDLVLLRRLAEEHGTQLGLGAVFAAVARTESGCVPEHTSTATSVLAELTVADAVALAGRTAVTEEAGTPGAPAYEVWRAAIRAALAEGPRHRAAA
ncbi:MAG: UnbL [uncultured Pseudonocardia sp.]|uniref:UnbL n=1 Tax=uncultured Pseudonocardia sp. TaxID=211455 RepID=A0A6J4PNS6_9PSEU|nr:MAG: UnbL [uncultured Pseudonocardia sp.]